MKKGIFLPLITVMMLVIFVSVGFAAIKIVKKTYAIKVNEKSDFINNLSYSIEIEKFKLESLIKSKLNEALTEFFKTSGFEEDNFFDGYPIWEFGFDEERNPELNMEERFAEVFNNVLFDFEDPRGMDFILKFGANKVNIETLPKEENTQNKDRTLLVRYKFSLEFQIDKPNLEGYKIAVKDAKACYIEADIKSCLERRGYKVEDSKGFLKVEKEFDNKVVRFALPKVLETTKETKKETMQETFLGMCEEKGLKNINCDYLDRLKRGKRKRAREEIKRIILHHTAESSFSQTYHGLKARGLSYHYVIDKDGTIYQLVPEAYMAWHAKGANFDSIGISLVNTGYANDQYTEAQYESLNELLKDIIGRYPNLELDNQHIFAHYEVSNVKWDPSPNFDWAKIGLPGHIKYVSMRCQPLPEFGYDCKQLLA